MYKNSVMIYDVISGTGWCQPEIPENPQNPIVVGKRQAVKPTISGFVDWFLAI